MFAKLVGLSDKKNPASAQPSASPRAIAPGHDGQALSPRDRSCEAPLIPTQAALPDPGPSSSRRPSEDYVAQIATLRQTVEVTNLALLKVQEQRDDLEKRVTATSQIVDSQKSKIDELQTTHCTHVESIQSLSADVLEKDQTLIVCREQLDDALAGMERASACLKLRNSLEKNNKVGYVLLPSGDVGALPAEVFNAVPGSLLAAAFADRWECARDAEGRAEIVCDSAVWKQIVNYLVCGAVPPGPQPELLSYARFWQLTPLINTLEARVEDIRFERHTSDDSKIFSVLCRLPKLSEVFRAEQTCKKRFLALDHGKWELSVDQSGIYLSQAADGSRFKRIEASFDLELLLRDDSPVRSVVKHIYDSSSGHGYAFQTYGFTADELLSEQIAREPGGLVFNLIMRSMRPVPFTFRSGMYKVTHDCSKPYSAWCGFSWGDSKDKQKIAIGNDLGWSLQVEPKGVFLVPTMDGTFSDVTMDFQLRVHLRHEVLQSAKLSHRFTSRDPGYGVWFEKFGTTLEELTDASLAAEPNTLTVELSVNK